MNSISPYDLETGHTYYIEYYDKGVFTYKAETGITYYSESNDKGVKLIFKILSIVRMFQIFYLSPNMDHN